MQKYIYIRVSTSAQSYESQELKLKEYMRNNGIDDKSCKIIAEKITSKTTFRQREVYKSILRDAQDGDILYTYRLDRLGRSMLDILELVDYAVKKGVKIITVDTGYPIENKTAMGRLYLGMLAAMAETERELRAERCQAGIDAARKELAEKGYRITRSGKVQTEWGGTSTPNYKLAAAKRTENAAQWRLTSAAYKYVQRQKLAGILTRGEAYAEMQKLAEDNPGVYVNRHGEPVKLSLFNTWWREVNAVSPVVED